MEKIKEKLVKNYIWIIFLAVTIIFVKIAEDVFVKDILKFDNIIFNYLLNHRNTILNIFFKNITQLGSAVVLLFFTILCILFIKNINY